MVQSDNATEPYAHPVLQPGNQLCPLRRNLETAAALGLGRAEGSDHARQPRRRRLPLSLGDGRLPEEDASVAGREQPPLLEGFQAVFSEFSIPY